jgi:beta-lactamase superfamily II metal-dependent hydrolase
MRFNKKSLTSLIFIFVAVVVAVFVKVGESDNSVTTASSTQLEASSSNDKLIVHYLDVGQGDSEFIELPNGECMLIDASISEYGDDIVESIEGYGYSKIDYLVATHPHADHIGGMAEVINNFDIGEIYMTKATSTSKTFENLLTTISDKGLQISTAKAGVTVYSSSELQIDMLAPIDDEYSETNNYSAVIKISYGKNSFLFTGDAEELVEDELLESNYSVLDCDVLKVGHHGSSSSSSVNFLDAVSPTYAVISCGVDNSYGHPHSETLTKLSNCGAQVYRTDLEGTITITCDGNDGFEVNSEK